MLSRYQDNTFRDDFLQQENYKFLEVGFKVAESPTNKELIGYRVFGRYCGIRLSPDGHFAAVIPSTCLSLCLDRAEVPKTEGDLFIPLDTEGQTLGAQFASEPATPIGNTLGYVFAQDAYNTISKEALAKRLESAELALNSKSFTPAMKECHAAVTSLGTGKYKSWVAAVSNSCQRLSKPQQTEVLDVAAKSLSPDISMFYDISDIVESPKLFGSSAFVPSLANAYSEWGAMGGNLMMRTNHIYALKSRGDFVGACAWGLITTSENSKEIEKDPYTSEKLLRGCKRLKLSQEADVELRVQSLLNRTKDL
ncbi:hypothetical protein C5F53_06990 [Rhodoferax sp. TS-BS-61-7]|nr:hypothetical protein C5F53_06990 [Rhodoferax sp. TS-BS-61-7]